MLKKGRRKRMVGGGTRKKEKQNINIFGSLEFTVISHNIWPDVKSKKRNEMSQIYWFGWMKKDPLSLIEGGAMTTSIDVQNFC